MAIVKHLSDLERSLLPPVKMFHYDDLQTKVRGDLYLELPQLDGNFCLLSPTLNPLGVSFEPRIQKLLQTNREILEYLKDRLMQTLIFETAILEGASYFLEQNGFLLLARLKDLKHDENLLEIKLYTASVKDLTQHYSDKIYIGRCFLRMEEPDLRWMGLNLHVLSLVDQYELLQKRSQELLNNLECYRMSFFREIQELLEEVVAEVIQVLDTVPRHFSPNRWDLDELRRIKSAYRGIVHLLLELAEEVVEFENVLHFQKEDRFARYVTKYKKDLKNIINMINFNVLSELSRRIQKYRQPI